MAERDVLTTGEVARMLKVTTNTVVKWFESGLLEGYTFPGTRTRRVMRASFEKFCKKRGIPIERIQRERFLTTGQCARICQVTVNTVTKWVDKKMLAGFTIESERRLIFITDLKKFMKDNSMPLTRLAPFEAKAKDASKPKKTAKKKKQQKKKKKARARKKNRGRKTRKK